MPNSPLSVAFNLPFEEAIQAAQARGVILPQAYYTLPDELRSHAFTISGTAQLDQIHAVQDALNTQLAQGVSFHEFKKQAEAQNFAIPSGRVDLIFRNAVQTAYNAGHWRNFEQHQTSRPMLMYDAVNDNRTRPAHRALDGIIRPVDDAFWATHSPPCGHRCFLPDTKVGGRFEIGLKAFYSGVAVEIITSNGNRLAVTANHPILTRYGMIRADEVMQGFDLVADCRDVDAIAAFRDINNEQLPSRADEVFDALALEAFGLAQAASFDLYGDAAFIQGDVQVVGHKGALMHGFKSAPLKLFNKWIFKRANHLGGTLACRGINKSALLNSFSRALSRFLRGRRHDVQRTHSFQHRPFGNPHDTRHSMAAIPQRRAFDNHIFSTDKHAWFFGFLPRRAALAFHCGAVSFKHSPLNFFGFAATSDSDPSIKQKDAQRCASNTVLFCRRFFAQSALIVRNRFNWNRLASLKTRQSEELAAPTHRGSAPLKASIDGSVAATELLGNLINGQAAQVKFAQVLSVRQFHYSGHVYDFQTDNGLIIAEGIYTSNCRCTLISLTEAQARARSPSGEGLNKAIEGLNADKGWGYKPTQQGEKLKQLEADKLAKASPVVVAAYNARMRNFRQPEGGHANIPFNPHIARVTPDTSTMSRLRAVELENRIRYDKVLETGAFFNAKGEIFLERTGLPGRVEYTHAELLSMRGNTFTHCHTHGNSFSYDSDLAHTFDYDFAEIRAVTKQFRYIVTKKDGVWPSSEGLRSTYPAAKKQALAIASDLVNSGELDYAYAENEVTHRIITYLAKKLGFNYLREAS